MQGDLLIGVSTLCIISTLCVYRVAFSCDGVIIAMMVLYGAIVHYTDDDFLLKDLWIKASSS